jgi:hypothetical protein
MWPFTRLGTKEPLEEADYYFEPLEDISAYELAIVVSAIRGYLNGVIRIPNRIWNELGTLQRHFRRTQPYLPK